MFEHKELDGVKVRLLPATEAFINEEVLEKRESRNSDAIEAIARQQYGVVGSVLVERYLPPETVGTAWSHDPGTPWWEVVGHPPHAGLVADFNKAKGGEYRRVLKTDNNVVAYAEQGEEVVFGAGEYKVVRKSDSAALSAASLAKLRTAYYA